ncbi:MAG: aldehyde dehydrogenase [Symbiobacteriia bacterium]
MEQFTADLGRLITAQREFFDSGATRSYAFRAEQLRRLRRAIRAHEAEIFAALKMDMGKPEMEAYASEIGFVYEEIRHMLRRLRSWMAPKRVGTPLAAQPATSFILSEPLGEVLIISPWNYPFLLLVSPLLGAIAGGNCAVVKPSELAPHTAAVIEKVIAETFPAHYVATVQGGPDVAQVLLARQWDYIFFTGSGAVGRIVARAAAEHLTPTTLELGGKSPAIVHRDAKLDVAARRIVWGKFFNAGQTCVAPDYVLAQRDIKEELLAHMKRHLAQFFGPDPKRSEDYARIVNQRHFDRLSGLLGAGRVVAGGEADRDDLYIAPTILAGVPRDAPVMQEEIFGPILPVIEYETLDEAIATVRRFPKPLSLYLFTGDHRVEERILRDLPFGGGCINDTLMHLTNPHLPFGGVGPSGMGAYHGKFSFDTFSHRKGIVRSLPAIEVHARYQPYRGKMRLARMVMK